jgi:predicted glycosyltransferase
MARSGVHADDYVHSIESAKADRTNPAISGRASTARIVLYSHDTMGLGHVRRNLLIAQALQRSLPKVEILLITGASEATSFSMPPNVDCLTLPRLYKQEDGSYRPRQFTMPLAEMTAMRSSLIQSAIDSFKPDLLIVDNVPLGALKELDPVLRSKRSEGRTQCVLGLRDVLDNPEAVRREWPQPF